MGRPHPYWVMNGSTHSSHTTSTPQVSNMVCYGLVHTTILISVLSLSSPYGTRVAQKVTRYKNTGGISSSPKFNNNKNSLQTNTKKMDICSSWTGSGLAYPYAFRIVSNWSWSLIIVLNWSGHTGRTLDIYTSTLAKVNMFCTWNLVFSRVNHHHIFF